MAKYYFTFGSGQKHENCYVEIEAESWNAAREIMVSKYGTAWSFQYTASEWMIDPKIDPYFKHKARMFGVNPNRTEPISQAELFKLTKID